jgi:hypothetical protein
MRRVISFVAATGLLLGGLIFLALQIAIYVSDGRFYGLLLVAAGLPITLGGYWLYEDFLKRDGG